MDTFQRGASPQSNSSITGDPSLSLRQGYKRVRPIQSKNGQRIEKMLIDKILDSGIVTNSCRREQEVETKERKKSIERRQKSPFVERSFKWKEERDLKVQRARHLQEAAILKLCTFEPTISVKSRRTVKKLQQSREDTRPFSQFFSFDTTQAADETNRKILEAVSEKTEKATTDVIRSGRQSTQYIPRVGSTELCGPEAASSDDCSASIPEEFEQSFQVNDRRESYRPSLQQ